MDIHQLRTFVAVARAGTITRASEALHLSQPAVSAHIKGIEDTLGLALFERTPKGMSLTRDGERLLEKAEQTIAAHQALLDEASRSKGRLAGKLRLGAGSSSNHEAVGRLLTTLSERSPEVEVALRHGTSLEILAGIRNGTLDAGFYNEAGEADPDLEVTEVARFGIHVVAPLGLVADTNDVNWKALAEVPWIYPAESACCGRTAERLFEVRHVRPKRIISVDRVEVTRALVASGVGVGLLHADSARQAEERGELVRLHEAEPSVRVLFARLGKRANEPLLAAASAIMSERARAPLATPTVSGGEGPAARARRSRSTQRS